MKRNARQQGKRTKQNDTRVIQEKFLEERRFKVQNNPIVPMNQKQELYMQEIRDKSIVIATGYAGTSKTYIPTAMAADAYKLGDIDKIIVTRPAFSSSQSVGFTSGDFTQKMLMWLGGVVPVLKERLGNAEFDIALAKGDIQFIPLEVVKGMSINNAFFLVEESSDLTKEEVIKLVTRMGKNSTLVLAGDIRQSELNTQSGLTWLVDFVKRHRMNNTFGFVDFDSTDDIVRSKAVKEFIINLVKDERRGK